VAAGQPGACKMIQLSVACLQFAMLGTLLMAAEIASCCSSMSLSLGK
jgi:hypothetical protein